MDFVIIEGVRAKLLVQVTYAPGKPDVRARVHKALAKASEELGVRDALVITWDYLGEEEPGGLRVRYVPLWLLEAEKYSPPR